MHFLDELFTKNPLKNQRKGQIIIKKKKLKRKEKIFQKEKGVGLLGDQQLKFLI